MPLQEQAELWMALRDRMKENWQELTIQEKKAGELYSPPPSDGASGQLHGQHPPVETHGRAQDGV